MTTRSSLARATVQAIKNRWDALYKKVSRIDKQIDDLRAERDELFRQLRILSGTYELFSGKHFPSPPSDQRLRLEADSSIGDLIEKLLREHGTMTTTEIRSTLQSLGRLKSKNARIVLANAIKRDKKNRFVLKSVQSGRFVTKGGRVSLTRFAATRPDPTPPKDANR